MSNFRFALSATFTAEPVESVLSFWGRRLSLDLDVQFAPYNQVSQTLLDPAGLFTANQHGLNAILLRLEDLAQFDRHDPATLPRIEANLRALLDLVRVAPARMSVPLVLVLCPSSPEFLADPARARFVHEMTALAEKVLDDSPGIQSLTFDEIERLYPVLEKHSPEGERLGRIPYTDLYFCAFGTALVRLTHGLFMPPFKVIALDCDNTLWRGICGEDGPGGVAIDPPYRALQRFMVDQRDSGMLLTLASKNNPDDVLETFEQNPEMPLQFRHFVTTRLNWDPKPVGLESMADELSLGVDSFILVDDSPRETAQVSESLPEVLALTLPYDAQEIPHFLNHVWAFDHVVVTEEDRQRNVYYTQAQEFGRELAKAQSAEHFLDTLALEVRIQPLTPERLPRTAQLTQRTNQFNFTTIRRTEQEIVNSGLECRTIDVSDRFGDYGLTGVILFNAYGDSLVVDTFLLSCRVLGRGVEHRVMSALAEAASSRGLAHILANLVPTAKNKPARDFLETIGTAYRVDGGYCFPVAALLDLKPQPAAIAPVAQSRKPTSPAAHKRPDYQAIARQFSTAAQVHEAMFHQSGPMTSDEPMTEIESKLAAIWCDLLKRPSVPLSGNFFDLGGHSLLAVALIMRVKQAFDIELPIDDVYAAGLTLGDLARKVEAHLHGAPEEYDAILRELESLSDEEVERLLAEESGAA